MIQEWTESRVRDELPKIACMYDGRKVIGEITGRCNRWATVRIEGQPSGQGYMFSWSTLANCLNTGKLARI